MKPMQKWIAILAILVFGILADQLTKYWAQENLASPRYDDHAVTRVVETNDQNLESWMRDQYPRMSQDDRTYSLAQFTTVNDQRTLPSETLKAGDTVASRLVSQQIIEGYWDYIYARNPGAAWSFLANADPMFRRIFFSATSLIAILLISFFLFKMLWDKQKLMIISLSMVLAGAFGNVIDRVRFGYVIDFISWHVGEHYWPTFNIADAFITVAVAFILIDVIRQHRQEKKEKAENNDQNTNAPEAIEAAG